MVASANIKTPSMEVPFLPNVSDKAKDALRISLNKVTLANVLEAVHVTEKIEMSRGCRKRLIKMRFEFLPRKQYKDQVCTLRTNKFGVGTGKVLFTSRCRRQNFRPSLLRLVNN